MMDFNKAISILGLDANFTEEDLKKAHRKLTVENHPDKHQDSLEMNERQTQINAARDFLTPYAKKGHATHNGFNLNDYIQEKVRILEEILKDDSKIITDYSYKEAYESIKNTINTFKTDVFISFILTKTDVDNAYNECMFFIKYALENFKESFYKKHHIDENEVKETLVYNCSLKHFYEQLLEIEKKYSKEAKLQKLLEKEIEKYKTYDGYKVLYGLIMICKNNTIIRIRKKRFKNIEEEISNMHQLIEKEVFEAYYSLQERISNLVNELSSITNEQLQKEYESLKHEFLIGTNFDDIEKHITKIEQLLKEYNDNIRKQQEFKGIEDQVNNIYRSLIDKYSEVLKKYNPLTEYDTIKKLNELFGEILEMFKQGCEQYKGLDYFKLFTLPTFEDISKEFILKKSRIKIYLRKERSIFDERFYILDEENMYMHGVNSSGEPITPERAINKEILKEKYISLEEFLKDSRFVGQHIISSNLGSMAIIYGYGDLMLLLRYGQFDIGYYDIDDRWSAGEKDNSDLQTYADKEYVYSLIEEQIKQGLKKYNIKYSGPAEDDSQEKVNKRK